ALPTFWISGQPIALHDGLHAVAVVLDVLRGVAKQADAAGGVARVAVDLGDGLADLLDAQALLADRAGDLRGRARRLGDGLGELADGLAGGVRELDAALGAPLAF